MNEAWHELAIASRNYKIDNIAPGDIVKLRSEVLPFVYHYGIVFSEGDTKYVYHNTPDFLNRKGGSIVRETFNDWVKTREILSVEKTGMDSEKIHEVVKRVQDKKYDVLTFNCEHFTSYIKEKQFISPQVAQWAVFVATISITYIVFKKLKF